MHSRTPKEEEERVEQTTPNITVEDACITGVLREVGFEFQLLRLTERVVLFAVGGHIESIQNNPQHE